MAATEDQTQKKDGGKPKMSRFPLRAVTAVVRVLEFGKHKYGMWGGWKNVDNAEERYADAFFRHVADLSEFGLSHTDEESGLPTLAHAVCDGVFLLWFTVKSDPGQPWLKAANTDLEDAKHYVSKHYVSAKVCKRATCVRGFAHDGECWDYK